MVLAIITNGYRHGISAHKEHIMTSARAPAVEYCSVLMRKIADRSLKREYHLILAKAMVGLMRRDTRQCHCARFYLRRFSSD